MSQVSVNSPVKMNLMDDATSVIYKAAVDAVPVIDVVNEIKTKMKNIVNLFDIIELYEEVTAIHPEVYFQSLKNKYFLIKHSDTKYEFMPVSQMSWFINMEFNKDIKLWKVYGTRTKY
jgi:hypothetical protein